MLFCLTNRKCAVNKITSFCLTAGDKAYNSFNILFLKNKKYSMT